MFVRRTAAPSTVASGPIPEWVILRTWRPNVLFTGWRATTDVVMATLRPYLRPPVYCWAPDTALPTPHELTTLLICDVATLSLDQQRALFSWMDQAPSQTQVVSTTALELFPLVEHGTFLEALYYRLNTMRLDAPIHRLLGNDLAECSSTAIPTHG